MSLLLQLFLVAATAFRAEDIDGLRTGPVIAFSGRASVNFRHADLDRDGKTDLVLPSEAIFQREGAFPTLGRAPLPDFGQALSIDEWNGALYFKMKNRLVIVRWAGDDWETESDQVMPWESVVLGSGEAGGRSGETASHRLRRKD